MTVLFLVAVFLLELLEVDILQHRPATVLVQRMEVKVSAALKTPENSLKDLTELQKQLRIYGRTKDMYGQFQQSRNKDKFIRETDGAESDVILHETAKRYLSAYKKEHGNVPKSAELKPLLATLQKEKSALYEQYKKAKAEQMELMKLHSNLQKILGKEQKQQEVDR